MKRPKQHKIDAKAQKIFNSTCPDYWSIQEPNEDYGIDYYIKVFDDVTGKAKPIFFAVQLKGTEYYDMDDNYIKFRFNTDTLEHYLNKVFIPICLIIVETSSKQIHYLFLHEYINETLNVENPNWINQKTVTLYIPKKNKFIDFDLIEECAKDSIKYANLLVNGVNNFDLESKVAGIINNPIKKEELLNSKYEELFIEETKLGIQFFEDNNYLKSEEKFLSVFEKTKNNNNYIKIHLKSLMALISFFDISNILQREKLITYIDYGLNLAIKFNLIDFAHYFQGSYLELYFFIFHEKINSNLFVLRNLSLLEDELTNFLFHKMLEDLNNNCYYLNQIYSDFFKNLEDAINNDELLVFSELLYKAIHMELFMILNNIPYFSKEELKPFLDKIFELINIFKDIVDFIDNINLKFKYLEIKSKFYYYSEDDKCLDVIKEYSILASNYDSKVHINKANELKEQYTNEPISLLKSSIKKPISEDEIDEYYKELFLKDGIDINNTSDSISNILRIGIKDRNPERVLKNCSFLEIVFTGGGIPAKVYALPSAGTKLLYCKNGGVIEGLDLDYIYEDFEEEYCKDCPYKNIREKDWNWSTEWQITQDNCRSEELNTFLKKRFK